MPIGEALSVVFTGIAVVALALLLLMLCIQLMSKIMVTIQKSKKNPKTPVAPNKAPDVNSKPPVNAVVPQVEDGIPEEVVAAIAAAVSVVTEGKGTPVSIRRASSSRRSYAGRNEWAMAGIRENTMPF
jgi:sodium pump decarboxylase gamma subunit